VTARRGPWGRDRVVSNGAFSSVIGKKNKGKNKGVPMKKIVVFLVVMFLFAVLSGCRSGPNIYVPPPVSAQKYKSVYIDVVYDPVLLVTYEDKKGIIEDLQSRIHAMGFDVSMFPDRADMTLKITINELILADRGGRLMSRATFGLTKNQALMIYTASFVDTKTSDEITSTTNELRTKKYFPSKEEIKAKFFSQMKDEILEFMSASKAF
jgi:hypothetical protein